MISVSKGMIGVAALIAAGFVSIGSLTDARPEPTPASVIADRFVFTAEIPTPVGEGVDLTAARRDAAAALAAVVVPMDAIARKGDRLDVAAKAACAEQTWPNIASECLVTEDGTAARRPARYVTVERRTAPSASELVRYQVTDVASR
jgi:hypothetical protein